MTDMYTYFNFDALSKGTVEVSLQPDPDGRKGLQVAAACHLGTIYAPDMLKLYRAEHGGEPEGPATLVLINPDMGVVVSAFSDGFELEIDWRGAEAGVAWVPGSVVFMAVGT